MSLDKSFSNPESRYRPIPFWSWNDHLQVDELTDQIKQMKQVGIGGFFMHARSGLKTKYLSKEWFDCIAAGISEAEKQDMEAWIYDEEGWPSGFAGGLVPEISENYHSRFMTMSLYANYQEIEQETAEHKIIAIYLYNELNNQYRKLKVDFLSSSADDQDNQIYADNNIPCQGEKIIVVWRHTSKYYIDTLNKGAVDAFLQKTHQEYYKRFGADFGKVMKGFFTDEPRLPCNRPGDLAWSEEIINAFQSENGYDIRDHLPSLFMQCGDYRKHRFKFWKCVNDLFAENYMKTIYDWCELHDCQVTGHIMMEESIFSQMTSTGGVMPFYEYMHVPGIDWLRRTISSPVIAKQVGSVAAQLGRKQVLTESFALCGWDVSFAELKQIAEWQFVNGVNQICQHLQGYTIRGVRKRDYPPSLFVQQSWWSEYKSFNDYLGRVCVALSEGTQSADVLLLHPLRSGYIAYDGTRTEGIKLLDDTFTETCQKMNSDHISYHLGDERIMSRYGSVENGSLKVGEVGYATVILPAMFAVSAATVKLLLDFLAVGGTVISTGILPEYTDGDAKDLEDLLKRIISIDIGALRSYLEKHDLAAVSVTSESVEAADISYQQRDIADGTLLYFVNHSLDKAYNTSVKVNKKAEKIILWNAENGAKSEIDHSYMDGALCFPLHFAPGSSYIITLCEKSLQKLNHDTLSSENTKKKIINPAKKWHIYSMGENAMTLDYCEYKIDDGNWVGPVPVIKLQNILLDLKQACDVELKFQFVAEDISACENIRIVVEDLEKYRLNVNGFEIKAAVDGWWKDKSFKTQSIKEHIRQGKNQIILKTQFSQSQHVYDVLYGENVYETEINRITYNVEIENIYLIGDFGVYSKDDFRPAERRALITDGPFYIDKKPKEIVDGNFTAAGLLFFADVIKIGQIVKLESNYKESGERILLCFDKINAPMSILYVNGKRVESLLWQPYQIDITDYVHEGENQIELELFASNRNLLGPHHHIDGECYNVGPESFTGKWSWVERKSEADATETGDRTRNFWTDSYCFVDFGFDY